MNVVKLSFYELEDRRKEHERYFKGILEIKRENKVLKEKETCEHNENKILLYEEPISSATRKTRIGKICGGKILN